MLAIFYDLETSDKDPIGQILNYSFICVDNQYEIVSELTGEISISKLQLPNPGAILANRIDVLEHQKTCKDSEQQAACKIWDFLYSASRAHKHPISLIGYNSARFDLPYLRTTFIRNGLNPYAWKSGIIDRDLILAVRKLACTDPSFPRLAHGGDRLEDHNKLSLRLETIAQYFEILSGVQTHYSRDDAVLCIKLSQILHQKYQLNPLEYQPYEAQEFEKYTRTSQVVWALEPEYDLNSDTRALEVPHTLLCANQNYALWVNLAEYQKGKGREALRAIKKAGGSFYLAKLQNRGPELQNLAIQAQTEFKEVNLDNFFELTKCDIEQFIYRLDFSAREALARAIWEGDSRDLSSCSDRDAKALYLRNRLANYEWGQASDSEMEKYLAQYAQRRYGGQTVLSKFTREGEVPRTQQTLNQLLAELEKHLEQASNEADRKLLLNLRQFYFESDIYRLAGESLNCSTKQQANGVALSSNSSK